ncbi:hypothetical protein [Anaerosalibacter massiliensis]|uniref:Uncharacterized protein n=2 Tax=Anaerosalibacter massiliensis TaxID=1347392 RepID=A0A9X2S515_9FIRM|nr:hypothetical protein [Anaerosalibacter massiliensis]MCR2044068.1 hypothetical protein [Anaerosalibacter massiliensis]
MNKFRRGKNKDIDEKNTQDSSSQNGKVNNIIEPGNIITNQSNKLDFDRLTDLDILDIQIKNKGFKSYKELVYELRLEDKTYFKYPASEWTESIKKAI